MKPIVKREHTSILMMCARQSAYKLLVVMAVMCVWEWMWFCEKLKNGIRLYRIYQSLDLGGIFVLAWILFTVILSRYGCRIKGQKINLFCRLQVPRIKIFCLQTLYNFASYFVLLGVQMMLFLFMGLQFCAMFPEQGGPQAMFMAFEYDDLMRYSEDFDVFFTSIAEIASPTANAVGWIIRIIVIGVFSVVTASSMCRIWVEDDE